MYFAYNSANTQCITTLTAGVMFTKHLLHSCVYQNVIHKMRMSLDSSFNLSTKTILYTSVFLFFTKVKNWYNVLCEDCMSVLYFM